MKIREKGHNDSHMMKWSVDVMNWRVTAARVSGICKIFEKIHRETEFYFGGICSSSNLKATTNQATTYSKRNGKWIWTVYDTKITDAERESSNATNNYDLNNRTTRTLYFKYLSLNPSSLYSHTHIWLLIVTNQHSHLNVLTHVEFSLS